MLISIFIPIYFKCLKHLLLFIRWKCPQAFCREKSLFSDEKKNMGFYENSSRYIFYVERKKYLFSNVSASTIFLLTEVITVEELNTKLCFWENVWKVRILLYSSFSNFWNYRLLIPTTNTTKVNETSNQLLKPLFRSSVKNQMDTYQNVWTKNILRNLYIFICSLSSWSYFRYSIILLEFSKKKSPPFSE